MAIAVLPIGEFADFSQKQIKAEAYEKIDGFPDFNLDMYIADLMSNSSKNNYSYQMLSYYINDYKSPNSVFFEELRNNTQFCTGVALWETENLIFDPSKEISKSLDEEGYYEAVILSSLDSAFKSDNFYSNYLTKAKSMTEAVYSNLELVSDTAFYIRNFKELKSSGMKDFGEAVEKSFKAVHPNIQLVWDSTELVDDLFSVCNTAYEFVEKLVAYQLCSEMTAEMKALVHTLYVNCDGLSYPAMKLALSNIDTACNSYALSIGEAFSDVSFKVTSKTLSKVGTKLITGCIAYFPVGKGLLLTEAITKNLVNFLLSTDAIIEQYYKMERLYNFEMLVRQTLSSQMTGYQSVPSEENAKVLFSAVDVFFNVLDISRDYVDNYAELLFQKNLPGKIAHHITTKIFQNPDVYNEVISWNAFGRANDKDIYHDIRNSYYLLALENEYPEIYEKICSRNQNATQVKIIPVLGVEFEKSEYELGMEDSVGNISASVQPTDATNQYITYTSSDPEIVEVSFSSLLPKSLGTATITATTADGGYTASAQVTVVAGHGADGYHIEPTLIKKDVAIGTFFTKDNLEYLVTSENTVEVSAKNTNIQGSVYIPSSIVYCGNIYNVTSILFDYCKSLTSVTIPNSVTSIRGGAFCVCESLTSVTIPDSVTRIEEDAFDYCKSLTSVTIPNSVTSIGVEAFGHCENLTSVTIPDSVTNIEAMAFFDCSSLTSVTIPDSVTSIGGYAFSGCSSLTSVTIPDSVTNIEAMAFFDCSSLTSIYGYTGSTAQAYAERYGRKFVALDNIEESTAGDANNDGQFTVADVIMLQKWLHSSGKLTNWKNADFNNDDIINIYDLCLMKVSVK